MSCKLLRRLCPRSSRSPEKVAALRQGFDRMGAGGSPFTQPKILWPAPKTTSSVFSSSLPRFTVRVFIAIYPFFIALLSMMLSRYSPGLSPLNRNWPSLSVAGCWTGLLPSICTMTPLLALSPSKILPPTVPPTAPPLESTSAGTFQTWSSCKASGPGSRGRPLRGTRPLRALHRSLLGRTQPRRPLQGRAVGLRFAPSPRRSPAILSTYTARGQ